jgi:hypothetical protein
VSATHCVVDAECSLSSQLRLRLTTLLDKKRVMQQHPQSVSKTSSRYVALEEGLKQFSMDLNKLEVIGPYALGASHTNPDLAICGSERNSFLQDPQEGLLHPPLAAINLLTLPSGTRHLKSVVITRASSTLADFTPVKGKATLSLARRRGPTMLQPRSHQHAVRPSNSSTP